MEVPYRNKLLRWYVELEARLLEMYRNRSIEPGDPPGQYEPTASHGLSPTKQDQNYYLWSKQVYDER